jgi:hypothetical protein
MAIGSCGGDQVGGGGGAQPQQKWPPADPKAISLLPEL